MSSSTRSVFIESRQYNDKINWYFSNRLWVNGHVVAIMPIEFGYDTQFMHRGIERLIELGYLSDDQSNAYAIRTSGVDLYTSESVVPKRKLFTSDMLPN